MVPPGPHFVFTRPSASDGAYAPVLGQFIWVEPRSVHVWRWDASVEHLTSIPDMDEAERIKTAARSMALDQVPVRDDDAAATACCLMSI